MNISTNNYTSELKGIMFVNNFRVTSERNELFSFTHEDDASRRLSVRLVNSEKVDIARHGSHNNNTVDGIGVFRFDMPGEAELPDYFIFAFQNLLNNNSEFVIITSADLSRRISSKNLLEGGSVYMWFWLMNDRYVYETTNIGMEGEWYFLSKCADGRMPDHDVSNYSMYLNNWSSLFG